MDMIWSHKQMCDSNSVYVTLLCCYQLFPLYVAVCATCIQLPTLSFTLFI